MIRWWRIWKYALGSFSDEKTRRYDNYVVLVRTFIFISYFITNCFITAGVIRHWNPMSKIDTQGMSGPVDPNYKGPVRMQPHKPMMIHPRRLFTSEYVKEMKILINEVLDEREHKKRMEGAYDNVEPLPPSYFDTENFKHSIDESEPEYKDWSQ